MILTHKRPVAFVAMTALLVVGCTKLQVENLPSEAALPASEAAHLEGVYVDDVSVIVTDVPTDTGAVHPGDELPRMSLQQNHPNPFSPSTLIRFSLATGGEVELTVYNIQGRLIRTLTEGDRPPGEYEAAWDGTDEYGIDVAAGVYLYRLRLGELEETRKMILVR